MWLLYGLLGMLFLGMGDFIKKMVLKKGLLAVVMTIIGIIGSHSYFKYIVNDIDIATFMFFKFLISFLFIILYMTTRKKIINFNISEIKKVTPYAFFSGIVFIIYFLYIIPNLYLLGPLFLGYKFLSYSIIIPIIHKYYIYKEKIITRRLIAFILTIINNTLFIF